MALRLLLARDTAHARRRSRGRGASYSLEKRTALVFAEYVAHRVAHLADRGIGRERVADRVEQVAVTLGYLLQRLELRVDAGLVAIGLELRQAFLLARLGLGID